MPRGSSHSPFKVVFSLGLNLEKLAPSAFIFQSLGVPYMSKIRRVYAKGDVKYVDDNNNDSKLYFPLVRGISRLTLIIK